MNLTKQNAQHLGKNAEYVGNPIILKVCSGLAGRKTTNRQHRGRTLSDNSDSSEDLFEINTITSSSVNSVASKYDRHVYATMNVKG